jgi:putative PEP-CTERM system histidine kinase
VPVLTIAGHALASVAFVAITILLLTTWRGRMRGSLLLVATAITAAWAAAIALNPATDPDLLRVLLELAKTTAWVAFLTRVLVATGDGRFSPVLSFAPLAFALAAVGASAWLEQTGGSAGLARLLPLAGLALSIFGFVLVEQVVRNTRTTHVWSAKFVWLAVGGLFAYDIALFSTSYVLSETQESLFAARGIAFACITPVLALGISRVRDYQPRALMSQKLAFYTSSVVIAGAYLVFVAVAGYYVRVLGGTWGAALQVVLVFIALLGLAITLLSSSARAWIRVQFAKHLFPYKYDYRIEWLDLTDRLTRDAEGSSLATRTLEAFARLARARPGGIWVLRDDLLQPAGGLLAGEGAATEDVRSPFCRFLEQNEWIVDLDALRAAQGQDAQVPVPDWLRALVDAWLAIPLLHDGRLVGLVVVGRPLAPERLTWEDLDLLRTAGRQAASYFALEVAADALAREKQFAAYSRFSAFMMHDLSNILAQQQLIVDNAQKHRRNPAFVDDAIDTIENTVRRMSRLLQQMREAREAEAPKRTVLVDVVERAVRNLQDRTPSPELVVEDSAVAANVPPERFEHVLEHVIRNAQDATPPDGSVRVVVRNDGDGGVVEVVDTGRGMDAEFLRHRLFKPFDSTKGVKGMGIGAFQTREFVRSAGGDVRVSSVPGEGTSFVIRFPRV